MNKYELAKKDFLSGKIKGCRKFFEKENHLIEAAYCDIVLDRLGEAREKFKSLAESDIRAHWGLCILDMISGNITVNPTYFEIRNFLEIDLSILIMYCKGNYVENIIKYANYMAYFNGECYKFLGRVFWAYNIMQPSMYFLNLAKSKMYKDPELHYMLAYIYYTQENDIEKCRHELDTCLGMLPEYNPAVKLLNKIQN